MDVSSKFFFLIKFFYLFTLMLVFDTTQQGDLDQCKCLTNYIDSREFSTFSAIGQIIYLDQKNF